MRLQKWFNAVSLKEKKKIMREVISTILSRRSKMCNILEYKDLKIVYKRLAVGDWDIQLDAVGDWDIQLDAVGD